MRPKHSDITTLAKVSNKISSGHVILTILSNGINNCINNDIVSSAFSLWPLFALGRKRCIEQRAKLVANNIVPTQLVARVQGEA